MNLLVLTTLASAFTRLHASSDHQQVVGNRKGHCSEQTPSVQQACNFTGYTVLGDSYAAGIYSVQELPICDDPNLSYCTTRKCGKDIGAYGYQFADVHRPAGVTSYIPCSGANTTNVITDQIVKGPFGNPELVTVSAGGDNDNVFALAVAACVYFEEFDKKLCGEALDRAENVIKTIDTDLENLYGAIMKTNCNKCSRTGVVTGYAQFWNATNPVLSCQSKALQRPSEEVKQRMNNLVLQMNLKLSTHAANNGMLFVDVDPYFEGHRFCDNIIGDEPWFHYLFRNQPPPAPPPRFFYDQGVFHPTAQGQNMYLLALEDKLGCAPERN